MRIRQVAVLTLLWFCLAQPGGAKSVNEMTGPANAPPASYRGKQFVDTNGCVFVRAGYGGKVVWVPRVARRRGTVICGYPPTFGAAHAATTVKAVAPKVTPRTASPRKLAIAKPASQPVPHRAVVPTRQLAVAAPRTSRPEVSVAGALPTVPAWRLRALCVGAAPSGIRYLAEGRSRLVVRCGGARTRATPAVAAGGAVRSASLPAAELPMRIPAGYKPAWTDGRLNPRRGHGTAAGEAAMDRIWTRTVPRRLLDRHASRFVYLPAGSSPATTAGMVRSSTMSSPARRHYVQVGSYADPANASRAGARLRGLGFVARAQIVKRNGRVLRVVMAGPFLNRARLQAALAAARRAGFGDAYIR